MTDLADLTATELIAAYRDGSISPVEAAQAALAAIDAGNDDVNAFVLVDHEGAVKAAERSEARWATAYRPRSRTCCTRAGGRRFAAPT